MFSVHAPSDEKIQEVKYNFYGELKNLMNTVTDNRIQIVIEDLNVKIAK